MVRIGDIGNDDYALDPKPSLPEREIRISKETERRPSPGDISFESEIVARSAGELFLYVNDAVLPVGDARSDVFYRESGPGPNQGAAIVTIVPKLPDSCQAACAPAAPPAASAISSNERRRAP